MSIYSLVDMIVVGQYEGAAGTAALACVSPLWAFFCCLSTLFGNGGAVLFSNAKGEGKEEESRAVFTVSFLILCGVTAVVWFVIAVFDESLLRLFGADDTLLPLAIRYMKWLKLGIPLWPVGYFLGMFVRNDGSPARNGYLVCMLLAELITAVIAVVMLKRQLLYGYKWEKEEAMERNERNRLYRH